MFLYLKKVFVCPCIWKSAAKDYYPVSLLSVLSKVFEKLVNNRTANHIDKCGLFSDFQYGFMSSRSTADLLTVLSARIFWAYNRSAATRAVALDISKAFERVWHAGLLHKPKYYGISHQVFGLPSSFLSNRRLWVVLEGTSWQEHLKMLEFLKNGSHQENWFKFQDFPGLFKPFSRTFSIKVPGLFQDLQRNSRTFQDFYGVVRIATTK